MRKKIFSVRFSLRNEKTQRQEHTHFSYKYIAQIASSRPRKHLFTDSSIYKGIGQLVDQLIDQQWNLIHEYIADHDSSNSLLGLKS